MLLQSHSAGKRIFFYLSRARILTRPPDCGTVCAMRLTINGTDRAADIGSELAAAPVCPSATAVQAAFSARRLQQPADEAAFLDELIRQLQHRNVVNLEPFRVARRPGRVGALLAKCRAKLWKFMRYQHEHVTAQQNDINQILVAALEFEHHARQNDIGALRRRLEELERKTGAS
jgi:hypothetical protein